MSRMLHKTIGRTFVLICLMLFVQTSLVRAAEDITGQWELTVEFGGRQSFATLSISKKADGALAGKWGSSDLSDVKFQDGKLTFVRIIQFGDQEFIMDYAGTLKDGKITGAMSSDRGEFATNGARFKPKNAALGIWDISFNIGDRDVTGKLAISEKSDGALEGKWISERGNTAISNVKFKDGKLTFNRKSTFGDNTWESDFEGTIAGHNLTGVFKSQQGEMPAKGTRVGAALVGKWELTTVSEFGTNKSMMLVNGDMTGRYESFGSDLPMKNLKLEGDQVTFALEMGWGDQTVTLDFKGKLDGKNLTGQIAWDSGTGEVTGRKAEQASAVVGTWEFTRESSRGTRTSTLKIKPDMTGTYTVRDNEIAVTDLKADGNQVSFKVTMRYGENEVPMEFKGKVDGKTLKGEFVTQRGAREAIGKKID
ncbi:MAG TPA: hypothetical protein VMX36_12860 [Sedimentisphaerales bacterium]|nr:hypothetical protein [Sedimentisphaerales bacterium]